MRIVSVILEHEVITKILVHLARKGIKPGRGNSPTQPPSGAEGAIVAVPGFLVWVLGLSLARCCSGKLLP